MRICIIVFCLVVLGLKSPVVAQSNNEGASASDIENLSWLLGTWKAQLGTKTYVERWYSASDGSIHGVGHYVASHDSTLAEVLIIQPIGDKLVYIVYPVGQQPALFVFTEATVERFLVENPEHDFPQRIAYKKSGDDAMNARVSGVQEGQTRGFDVAFSRVSD